jgi:hypothetical protein
MERHIKYFVEIMATGTRNNLIFPLLPRKTYFLIRVSRENHGFFA